MKPLFSQGNHDVTSLRISITFMNCLFTRFIIIIIKKAMTIIMWIVVCYRWVWRVPSHLPWVVWVVQWRDQCPAGSGATNGSAFSADLRLLAQRQARLCRVAGDWTLRQLAGSWGRPWLPRRDLASSVSRQRSQLWRYRVSQQAWYQGMTIDVSKPKLLSLFITIYFSLYYLYT